MKSFHESLGKNIAADFNRVYMAMAGRLNEDLLAGGIDVTAEQVGIMILLWQRDGRTQHEMAEILEKDKASITRLLHGLEKRRLVRRVINGTDRRNKNIYLTRKGREIEKKTVAILKDVLIRAVGGIAQTDLDVCRDVLAKMTKNLAG